MPYFWQLAINPKLNNFLQVCWFLFKNLSNFVPSHLRTPQPVLPYQTPCNKIQILTCNGCFLKILANFSKGDMMNSRAINPVKMSFVNFVKYFTNTAPWNAATTSETTINQIPTHTLHAKKSMSLPIERKNIKVQILFSWKENIWGINLYLEKVQVKFQVRINIFIGSVNLNIFPGSNL